MTRKFKQFNLNNICRAVSSKNTLIKGKQIQGYRKGLYPAYSATGQDIWREEYEHEGSAIIVSAVGARCGKCFRADGKWTAIANTHIIFPKEGIDRDYLFYNINKESFWEKGGLAQPFVKIRDTLRRKNISFQIDKKGNPDLKEQKRIVALLEETEELKRKRVETDQKMATIIPALFNQMFSMGKYESNKLNESITFMTSGARGWAKYYSGTSGFKYIRIQNVKNARLHFHDVQYVQPPESAEFDRIKVQDGDLLISMTADLGRTAVVDKITANEGAFVNQHLGIVRLDKSYNPLFVAYYLEGEGKSQFTKYGQAATKKGLNFDSIKSLSVPKPPIKLQNQFVDKVDEIITLESKQKESSIKIDGLFSSLLSGAFK